MTSSIVRKCTIISKLTALWFHEPDLRFGQMLIWIFGSQFVHHAFYISDDELEQLIDLKMKKIENNED